jgi:uncharacterized protein (UPF0305 family)
MSINNEVDATLSPAAKEALENLAKDGFVPDGTNTPAEPDEHGEYKDKSEPKETPKEEPKEVTPEDKPDMGEENKGTPAKVEREVSYVPAWKLKVAEGQKDALAKELEDLRAKGDKLADENKSGELSKENKDELNDDVKAIAEKYGYDENFVKDIEGLISKKAAQAIPKDLLETVNTMREKSNQEFQERAFAEDFETSVIPLVLKENPDISKEVLSKIKSEIHDIAFSEVYSKVPLNEIFALKKSAFDIEPPVKKKSSENDGSGKARPSEVVDYDNMDEDTFVQLSPEKKLEVSEYMAKKGGRTWR